ncbi:MAG: DUF5615 family PIN-like protein [Bacteroidetes bacterium]|nr:DUF5615 family PIN-like protein [Bacteroidota bacterium]
MKLLANENFPLDSILYLRKKGYDIKAIGTDFSGITDKEIIAIAEKENRTIITFDKDYGELIFKFGNKPASGVIYLRLDYYASNEPGKIIERMLSVPRFSTLRKLTVFDGNTLRQRTY